jgi:N4-gp56 family major capsid protein
MTDTTPATGLVVQQWEDKFMTEYYQGLTAWKPLMGTNEGAVIQVKEDLTKKAGDSITIALVNRLTNTATTGTSVLEGNEEDMASRSMRIYVDKRRNAVRVAEMSEQRSAISLREAGRSVLLDWSMEDTRDLLITALGTITSDGATNYNFVDRTTAAADAYLVNNSDRIVFGAASAGFTDMSADLLLLDTTNDLFNTTMLDAMILKAKTCSPKIRPMRDGGNGKRYYVVFANPNAFKNLRDSMISSNALVNTPSEMENSQIWEGGDLHWNGCIVKEIDNVPIYGGLGTSSANVTPVYLCGAQALVVAWARRWKTMTEEFDYGDKYGVAIDGIYGVRKIIFGTSTSADVTTPKDNGVVTGFAATTGTATISSAIAAEG